MGMIMEKEEENDDDDEMVKNGQLQDEKRE